MTGPFVFLFFALLATMVLALGVIVFFGLDAWREGRRFLNSNGEEIVAKYAGRSKEAIGKVAQRR